VFSALEDCSRWFLTSAPIAFISALKICCTSGMQPPQPAPALVQDLTSPTLLQVPSFTTLLMSPLLTLWHEQTCVSSGLYSC